VDVVEGYFLLLEYGLRLSDRIKRKAAQLSDQLSPFRSYLNIRIIPQCLTDQLLEEVPPMAASTLLRRIIGPFLPKRNALNQRLGHIIANMSHIMKRVESKNYR
jgi:hypothetical protein